MGMALAGKGPPSIAGLGAAGRTSNVLPAAGIAVLNLHFVVDMSTQAQGMANVACVLLLLALVASKMYLKK